MNYHSDNWIMKNVLEHLNECKKFFPEKQIVGLFYYGSGNYGLDTESSDVATKLVTTPSLADIFFFKELLNTTYIRDNKERIDFKEVPLVFQAFREQYIDFIEILFTDYKWINPLYESAWTKLVDNREAIARYNPFAAVKSIKSAAVVEYHALTNEYPTSKEFPYDPRKLCNLIRLHIFLNSYIAGDSYEQCLRLGYDEPAAIFLKLIKQNMQDPKIAMDIAKSSIDYIIKTADEYCANTKDEFNTEVEGLLKYVQYSIIKIAI